MFGRTTVSTISLEELQDLMNADDDSEWVLVDVREPVETSVSVIPGAVTKEHFEAHREKYREHRVVAYCTLGGRSYFYARRQRKIGFAAENFQASILGWCRSNGQLARPDGEATNQVHTYSRVFRVPDRYEAIN